MKLWAAPVFLLAVTSSQAAVDPALLSLVMPEATLVAGIRVDQAQASPFGRYLISQMKLDAERDKLLAATGFDPLRDLQEIVVATSGSNRALVVAKGVFQPARIANAAGLLGAPSTTYKGIQLLGGGAQPGVAFLDASTIAIGEMAMVQGAIDRQVASRLYNGTLAQGVRDASGNFDAWFVAATPAELAAGRLPQNSQFPGRMLQAIQQVSGGVRFGASTLSFAADAATASPQDAQALVDVLRFLSGIAASDPKAASALQTAQFTASGNAARISLEVPEKDAENFFMQQQGGRRRR